LQFEIVRVIFVLDRCNNLSFAQALKIEKDVKAKRLGTRGEGFFKKTFKEGERLSRVDSYSFALETRVAFLLSQFPTIPKKAITKSPIKIFIQGT